MDTEHVESGLPRSTGSGQNRFNDLVSPLLIAALALRGAAYLKDPNYYSSPMKDPILPFDNQGHIDKNLRIHTTKDVGIGLIALASIFALPELRGVRRLTRRQVITKTCSAFTGLAVGMYINVFDQRVASDK